MDMDIKYFFMDMDVDLLNFFCRWIWMDMDFTNPIRVNLYSIWICIWMQKYVAVCIGANKTFMTIDPCVASRGGSTNHDSGLLSRDQMITNQSEV